MAKVGGIASCVLRSIDLNCDSFHMHSSDTSPAFFGYLCAIKEGDPTERAENTFREILGRGPDLVVSTPSYRACMAVNAPEKVGQDNRRTVTVALHGEIYEAVDNQAVWLAQRFAEHGFAWAKQIHGSFALVAIDKARDRVAVITDRLNSRRIFASQLEGGVCISSHLSAQPWESFELDAAGVAWYIANRIVGNSRTLLKGVSVLKRACVHQLTPRGLDETPYWRYHFDPTEKTFERKQSVGELHSRLVQAVQRRLYDNPNVFLSLSAGYDATGLLGIMAYDLHAPDVKCFSYEHGIPSSNSDAALSERMAQCARYRHETVETYDGDFVRHLCDNALILKKNQAWYCADVGAWQRIAPRLTSVERPAVFVGDECLGWRNCGLSDYSDLFASLQIYDMQVLSWLIPGLPVASQNSLKDGLESDLEQLREIARQEKFGNWHNSKDYLYLDQRLGNLILPWREACVPDGVAVRSPLLDNDVLDFMMIVPVRLRLNKRLYRKTITAMYPQLFAVPRSSGPVRFYLNLAKEFAENRAQVRTLIETTSSRLDDLIPPECIKRLLSDVVAGNPLKPSTIQNSDKRGVLTRFLDRTAMRLAPPRPEALPVKQADALMRLIVLRTALAVNR